MSSLLFFLGAARAIVEMLGLCLLGRGALAILAGSQRTANPIYRVFHLVTDAPWRLTAACLPRRAGPFVVGGTCFLLLLALWLGLALLRKSLST